MRKLWPKEWGGVLHKLQLREAGMELATEVECRPHAKLHATSKRGPRTSCKDFYMYLNLGLL